ncbi:hypothetical protein [Halopseudomonas salegens]|nr:hypothetical protein [Halopseudomonas salegens]
MSRIEFPLSSYSYEYGIDEHGREEAGVIKTDVREESIIEKATLEKYITENGLKFHVLPSGKPDFSQSVKIYKNGTDWLIEYQFERLRGYWHLIAMRDYSL